MPENHSKGQTPSDNMADHVASLSATPLQRPHQVDVDQILQAGLRINDFPSGLYTPIGNGNSQDVASSSDNFNASVGSNANGAQNNFVSSQLLQTIDRLSAQVSQLTVTQSKMLNVMKGPGKPDVSSDNHRQPATAPILSTAVASVNQQFSDITSGIPGLRSGGIDNLRSAEMRAYCPIEGISDQTIKSALKGEFIHLENFLLNLVVSPEGEGELCQIREEDGNVIYKPKRAKRKIMNIQTWLEAWQNYERLMMNYHRTFDLYEYMSDYRAFICEIDRKYVWSAIAAYDIRHRAQLSRKSVEFCKPNLSLQAQLLDSSALRTNVPRCYRCRSFQHSVSECPFPQGAPRLAPQKKKTEICRNFNNLKCVVSNCSRKHVCKGCYGELPFELCSKNGPCSSQVTT
jgi:hypothetical protein